MVYYQGMIDRQTDICLVRTALRRSRVVALLGPRQCGKTTLARQFVPADSANYFDLEDPQSLARLSQPDIALRPLKRLVVIDEIQRRPDLFPLLRVLADRQPLPCNRTKPITGPRTRGPSWTFCCSSTAAASASNANTWTRRP
jgi:predicted AAA+ superfamily ATPase